MFSYIIGEIERVDDNSIVVECGGIGYHMLASGATIANVRQNEKMKIYTNLIVREDGITLYGFATREEKEMFCLLTTVTGIGAKVALNLLSALPPSQIILAIVTEDADALSRAPGIGKKTAQRVIMELREKVKGRDAVADMAVNPQQSLQISAAGSAKQDAVDALLSLGYGRSESVRAVLEIAVEGMDAESIIKAALKKLSLF